MLAKVKCHVKVYHSFMVYLPVLIICSLIGLIYGAYVFTYISVLLSSTAIPALKPEDVDLINLSYQFHHTSSPESAITKGKFLLSISTYFLIMLIMCLLRTVFMDPGYFPSPLELEYKIILKNTNHQPLQKLKPEQFIKLEEEEDVKLMNKYSYISTFKKTVSESPLTFSEGSTMRYDIGKFLEPECNKNNIIVDVKNRQCTQTELEVDLNAELVDPFAKYKGVEFNKIIFCGTCLRCKVERSHHCRLCGRCVLKMDHHCPWLANCIGFSNYKNFCLISFYGVITTFIIAFTYWEVIVNNNLNYAVTTYEVSFCIFIYVSSISLFSFVFWLFLVNWRLVFLGLTVIENADIERFPSNKAINIYNHGYYKNFTTVFGNNPLVWFIPFYANYKGNGINFETNIPKKI